MNQPSNDPKDYHLSNDVVDALKMLRPRPPQLDWNAIHTARSTPDSTRPIATPLRSSWAAYMPLAMASCIGVAVGASFTYVAMNWIVLSNMQAKIMQLEKETMTASSKSMNAEPIATKTDTPSVSITEMYLNLDSPQLSVNAYRGRNDRLINVPLTNNVTEQTAPSAANDAVQSQGNSTAVTNNDEPDSKQNVLNPMQLLKELRQSIY